MYLLLLRTCHAYRVEQLPAGESIDRLGIFTYIYSPQITSLDLIGCG